MDPFGDILRCLNAGWLGTSQGSSNKREQSIHVLVGMAHPKVGHTASSERAALGQSCQNSLPILIPQFFYCVIALHPEPYKPRKDSDLPQR